MHFLLFSVNFSQHTPHVSKVGLDGFIGLVVVMFVLNV
jgi:hypothetical protein